MGRRRNPIGAHVPVAGGLARAALPYADAVGAECVQVFVSNPRGWAPSPGRAEQDALFRAGTAARRLRSFVHAPYLVNLGSPTPETVRLSVATLRHTVERAAAIGAEGVVFHAGSAVGPDRYTSALRELGRLLRPLLDEGGPRLLVEPTAGGGRALAATIADLGPFLDAVDGHPGLGVCLDTCHLWAAGHDLARRGGTTAMLDELLATVGPGRLGLIHANDSRDGLGTRRDRHANVGAGAIGAPAFRALFTHRATAGVPLVVETPDPDRTGAAHRADLARLAELRDPVRVRAVVAAG
jgi:deoxyribonuclease-4